MVFFIIQCRKIAEKFIRDEMTVYAAQASFFIVLSAFPFIMILLTAVQLVPNLSPYDVGATILALVPDVRDLAPLVQSVILNLYTNSPATVMSISIISIVIALWSASKGMLGVERGLNRAYSCPVHRSYLMSRLVCMGYTLLFLLACILSLLLIVFGNMIQSFFDNTFPIVADVTRNILSIRSLLAIVVLTSCFTGIYTYLPHRKHPAARQLPGAIFSTAGWLLFSYGFSIYFNHFSHFSYMYGSLTAVILLMLWIYFCICILFLGAEINYQLDLISRRGLL
ncbi:MAG TPA: YihY/virulence factor BrkB family protein [Candidatus Lachnoclostridium stercorigallinarum]|uniref:YihY/virulence factor BrkB family protein n=1 Tax=Candidatus Lachnoclostridium stercorigallinarum TaxID=2838634 RepID=A0A9D2GJ61_9FIRM|nr:YihY/virulence factor BrkB family protein [Candidatus Lachnoclostridium stercorigallinarum]